MKPQAAFGAIGALLAGLIGQASAQTMVEHSSEVRMQLDFVVPPAALAKFLPEGWEPNVATQGPAKDCNVRMIFIDRVDITKPDGSPATPGSNQLVYLAVPIKRSSGGAGKPTLSEEVWEFAAASGEHMEVRLKYERAAARKTSNEVKFFSSTTPSFYQIFKIDQGLDIMRNATVPVRDRVTEFSYKAGGGKIAPLFDGTEKVVSIDALHWYTRGVYQP